MAELVGATAAKGEISQCRLNQRQLTNDAMRTTNSLAAASPRSSNMGASFSKYGCRSKNFRTRRRSSESAAFLPYRSTSATSRSITERGIQDSMGNAQGPFCWPGGSFRSSRFCWAHSATVCILMARFQYRRASATCPNSAAATPARWYSSPSSPSAPRSSAPLDYLQHAMPVS